MAALSEQQTTTSDDRGALAKMVMVLFEHWQLNTEDQATLLGVAVGNRATLLRYRKGEPIGSSRDQYERVGHLLAIHKNLRLLFPQNRELAYRWMTSRNRAFDNLTPVEVTREWGFVGLLMVRSYLDRARRLGARQSTDCFRASCWPRCASKYSGISFRSGSRKIFSTI